MATIVALLAGPPSPVATAVPPAYSTTIATVTVSDVETIVGSVGTIDTVPLLPNPPTARKCDNRVALLRPIVKTTKKIEIEIGRDPDPVGPVIVTVHILAVGIVLDLGVLPISIGMCPVQERANETTGKSVIGTGIETATKTARRIGTASGTETETGIGTATTSPEIMDEAETTGI